MIKVWKKLQSSIFLNPGPMQLQSFKIRHKLPNPDPEFGFSLYRTRLLRLRARTVTDLRQGAAVSRQGAG
jgi:hypothetical protein